MDRLQKIIFWLFALLLFFVPLILWPFTSEVFEFNKIVLVYALSALIVAVWLTRTVLVRKIIFRRTILDVPLLVFLGSQLISTLLSIDPSTSWLGYYSRFNGGFLSTICYSLLYWAFVSNLDRKFALLALRSSLFAAVLVSIYGILEHFGIDKNVWVQDVQSRVFSTLGQPNWLSAWLTALIPITWALGISKLRSQNSNLYLKSKSFWVYILLSGLFFWTLIFTKSRSGILGFGVAFVIFWGFVFWSKRKQIGEIIKPFVVISSSLLVMCLISGTQFTPSLSQLIKTTDSRFEIPNSPQGPALETGGTESGTIRKIVWKGAIRVWQHYPLFGSGVETFAYSYYLFRPAEHNLTSEWDFIYNKAHNEYLNFLANSGTVGLISYLILIGFSIYQIVKNNKLQISNHKQITNYNIENLDLFGAWSLRFGILTGYTSLLVTNFFGFSVVPIQLEFFLFPAIAFTIAKSEEEKTKSEQASVSNTQKIAVGAFLLFTFYFLLLISRYWYADTLYSSGKAYNTINKPDVATGYLINAINLEPNQALYYGELSSSYARLALAFNQQKDTNQANQFSNLSINNIDKAISLSPANVNLKRIKFGVLITLSAINQNYLIDARDALISAITQAPTDTKLFYNLGLTYARTGQKTQAIETLKRTIELKSNYKEARLAYAYLLIDAKETQEAKSQLEYILTNIDPNDSLTKQALESIR